MFAARLRPPTTVGDTTHRRLLVVVALAALAVVPAGVIRLIHAVTLDRAVNELRSLDAELTATHEAAVALVAARTGVTDALTAPDSDDRLVALGAAQSHWDRARAALEATGASDVGVGPAPVSLATVVERVGTASARAVHPDTVAVLRSLDAAIAEVSGRADGLAADLAEATASLGRSSRSGTAVELAVAGVGLVVASGTGVLLARRSRQEAERALAEAASRAARDARDELDSRLARAYDMAATEEAAIDVTEAALTDEQPGLVAELLLADSSRAHLHQALSTDRENRGPGCPVATPADCPAVRRGHTLTFADSGAFDACPHLRGRGGERCSATCVPVSIGGRTAGVLHAVGAVGDPPAVEVLQTVAMRAGDRIGYIRAFARTETQATTDPLTGLANRRHGEERLGEMLRSGRVVAVGYGDLDHFKALNDTHGHETGDRALRLFARVLRDSLRPDDLACRWGGEEFVVALPGVAAPGARRILERVRERLALALADSHLPPFTVSFGVADITDSEDVAELVAAADRALLEAKRSGRNRVVITGEPATDVDGPVDDEPAAPSDGDGRPGAAEGDGASGSDRSGSGPGVPGPAGDSGSDARSPGTGVSAGTT